MAKRSRSRSQTPLRAVELPSELWCDIAGHLPLQDTATVFSFLLCCRAARTFLEPALRSWVQPLCTAYARPKDDTPKSVLLQLEMISGYAPAGTRLLAQAESEPDLCLALYYAYHMGKLRVAWKLDRVSDGQLSHQNLHLADIQLRDVFHYDETKRRFVSFCHQPGLRTVELEASKSALAQQMRDFIRQDAADRPGQSEEEGDYRNTQVDLMLRGIDRINDATEMRVAAYRLMRNKLVTHKPHRTALLCNAVIDGRHLFDRRYHATLRGRLCVFKYRNLTQHQKAIALKMERDQTRLREQLARRLTNPKRAAAPPRLISLLDDEDEKIASSSDDDTVLVAR